MSYHILFSHLHVPVTSDVHSFFPLTLCLELTISHFYHSFQVVLSSIRVHLSLSQVIFLDFLKREKNVYVPEEAIY